MSAVIKLTSRIRIEKGVPMPPRNDGRPKPPCPFPFLDMVIGDSFFVPHDNPVRALNTISKFRSRFMKENPGYKFECRRVKGGARCWRTK